MVLEVDGGVDGGNARIDDDIGELEPNLSE
jgi:hypothetical protein